MEKQQRSRINTELSRAHIKVIEIELRNYPTSIARLQDLQKQQEADEPGAPTKVLHQMPATKEPGDQTYRQTRFRAGQLQAGDMGNLLAVTIHEISRRVAAIDYVLESGEPEKVEVVKLFYWRRGATMEGVALGLQISPATAYRYRNEIIREIGERMGWVV